VKYRTKSGHVVHEKTEEFHNAETRIGRLNARLGNRITLIVGTMGAAYLFTILALFALPSAIHQGTYFVIVWLSSSFLQLVLLPIIIVGQNIQAKASDIRSAKTFEDTEKIVDSLSLETEGGLADVLKELQANRRAINRINVKLRQSE
jgi:hypothetical protein